MIAASGRIVTTQREVAIALGVSERMVRNYVREGMPHSQNFYDLDEIEQWRDKNMGASPGDGEPQGLKEKRLRAEIRKLNADADAKEFKNAIMRGELMYRDDVERQVAEAFLVVKTQLEIVPDAVEMLIPQEQRANVKEVVAERVRQMLLQLAATELEASEA